MGKATKPVQPIVRDSDGVERFDTNTVIAYLVDVNAVMANLLKVEPVNLATMPWCMFDQADINQFYQLIGYSLGGYQDLPNVSDEAVEAAKSAVQIR